MSRDVFPISCFHVSVGMAGRIRLNIVFADHFLRKVSFQVSLMVFRCLQLVFMIFQGSSMFFHAFWLVFIFGQGSFMVFEEVSDFQCFWSQIHRFPIHI